MMRRTLAAAGASLLALACIAPGAWAAESIPDGNWSGSALDAGPTTVDGGSYWLSGAFQHVFNRQVEVTIAASAGTGACAVSSTTLPRANAPRSFRVMLSIPCNGTYTLVASAITTDDNPPFMDHETASLDRTVSVAAPAPTVSGVQATADGRSVAVSWDDMTGAAPDLSGYIIERKIGEGSFQELAVVDAHQVSFDDSALPAQGGQATYRIFATRPSPNGSQVSAASDEAGTPFVAAPQDSTDTTSPGGGTGATGGSSPGAADGSGTSGSGGTAASAGGSRTGVRAPSIFSGTFLPPLLRPAAQTIGATTPTADAGFSEALPYELGTDEEPVLPNDAMASILTDDQAGRGMAIPVATALVLAIWAFHLRMLARAARPPD